jgi:hypothetical protein
VRLTRSNDDPKLLDDLERLARVHGDPDREPRPLSSELVDAPAPVEDEAAAEAVEATPLDDPFVRRFVRVSVHLKRYAPFYAGAAVWALAMLLIQPLGGGDDAANGDLASASTAAATSGSARASDTGVTASVVAPTEEVAAAPVFDDFGGSALSSSSTSFESSGFSSSSSDFASGSDSSSSSSSTSDAGSTATFDDSSFSSSDFGSDEPAPLTITASGYASSVGGTPLEQDPGSGILPVAATGGNDNKRSFIKVSGDETTLRLKEAADGNVRSDAGGVKACLITVDWQPARGQALSASPAFDSGNCATGVRDAEGVWTFDLSTFAPLADTKGFALTPAAGTASTFEARFLPAPVASAS